MSQSKDQQPARRAPAKREYQSPRIEETGNFERLVLACTHTPGGGAVCTDGQPQS
jgi:hypothetical protein